MRAIGGAGVSSRLSSSSATRTTTPLDARHARAATLRGSRIIITASTTTSSAIISTSSRSAILDKLRGAAPLPTTPTTTPARGGGDGDATLSPSSASSSSSSQQQQQQQQNPLATWALAAALAAAVAALSLPFFNPQAALAAGAPKANSAEVGKCLLSRCQGALAQCLGDAGCAKNLVCLNACSLNAKDGDDETACQIRCGDRYGDAAVESFNACAVSEGKCVPQRADEGMFPVPPDCALDGAFDLSRFTGRWYITAGLNELFDTFDCQVHYFATTFDKPGPSSLAGKLNWRIAVPGGDFIERSTVQTFLQPDPTTKPGVLLNHGNEVLHYEDDWYVLASKPDEYALVYYRGNNDAWSGYGGAVVYTKASSLPKEYVPELEKAAAAAGLKWSDFKLVDNTCPPHPDKAPSLGAQVARELGKDAARVEGSLEGALKSFGRGFTRIERAVQRGVGRELSESERVLEREFVEAERLLGDVERSFEREEREITDDVGRFVRRLFGGGLGGGGK